MRRANYPKRSNYFASGVASNQMMRDVVEPVDSVMPQFRGVELATQL